MFSEPKIIKEETIQDNNPQLYLKRALKELEYNNIEGAVFEINKAIKFSNNKADYIFEKIKILYDANMYNKCLDTINDNFSNLEKNLNKEKLDEVLNLKLGKIHFKMALKELESNNILGAVFEINKAIHLSNNKADYIFEKIKIFYNANMYDKCLDTINDNFSNLEKNSNKEKLREVLTMMEKSYLKIGQIHNWLFYSLTNMKYPGGLKKGFKLYISIPIIGLTLQVLFSIFTSVSGIIGIVLICMYVVYSRNKKETKK